MKKIILMAVFLISSNWISRFALAKIVSVQTVETPSHMDSPNSITVMAALLPSDTYYNYSSLGVGVNHTISEIWSWTVFEYQGVFSSPSDSADYIKNKFSQLPDRSNRLKNMYSTGFIFSPLLLKNVSSPSRNLTRFDALQFENRWNPKILWADLALTLNYGKAQFDTFKNADLFSYGILFRFYESNKWSMQLDFKNIAFVQSELVNQVYVSFGFSKYFDIFNTKTSLKSNLKKENQQDNKNE